MTRNNRTPSSRTQTRVTHASVNPQTVAVVPKKGVRTRTRQAEVALTSPFYTRLQENSQTQRLAKEIIDEFGTTAKARNGVNITQTAIQAVLERRGLSASTFPTVRSACSVVRRALEWAYSELHPEQSPTQN